MSRNRSLATFVAVISLLVSSSASAQITPSSSPSSLFAGTPETLIPFQFSPPTPEVAGFNSPAMNITITYSGAPVHVGEDQSPRPFGPSINDATGNSVDNDNNLPGRPGFNGQPIVITFSNKLDKISVESTFNGPDHAVVQFYDGSTLIGSATTPDNSTLGHWIFAGYSSTVPFNKVVLNGPSNGYIRIDNLRFHATITGPAGPPGPTGATGPTGPQGEKGDKGDQGETGAAGADGDKGDQGDKGDKGDKGDRGDKGDKGDMGLIGPIGPTGQVGPVGPIGPQGVQGLQGPAGASLPAGVLLFLKAPATTPAGYILIGSYEQDLQTREHKHDKNKGDRHDGDGEIRINIYMKQP